MEHRITNIDSDTFNSEHMSTHEIVARKNAKCTVATRPHSQIIIIIPAEEPRARDGDECKEEEKTTKEIHFRFEKS